MEMWESLLIGMGLCDFEGRREGDGLGLPCEGN